jgi:hypothetical protein
VGEGIVTMAVISPTLRPIPVLLVALFLIAVPLQGCQRQKGNQPQMFPVKGRVVYKNGEPLPGGKVQFQSRSDPSLSIFGDIQTDGRFSLFTLVKNRKLAGAVPGEHQVQIVGPMAPDQTMIEVRPLQTTWIVEPGENDFTIQVEKLPSSRR